MEETQFYKLIEEKIKKSVERFSDDGESNRRNDPRLEKVRGLVKKYSWFHRDDISSKFEYVIEDEKTGDILKYNLKTREVLLEIPSTGKHLFFNPRTKLWEEYTPEENKHYNLRTGKWEYYNDATGEWTSLTSAKEVDKDSSTVKMVYDKSKNCFAYIGKGGMAIYSPEKLIWGIHEDGKNETIYLDAIDGKEVILDKEEGKFVHKEIETEEQEKSLDVEENDAELEELLERFVPEQEEAEESKEDNFAIRIPDSEQKQNKLKRFSFRAIWNKVTSWFRGEKTKVAGYIGEAKKQAEQGINLTKENLHNGIDEAKGQLNKGVSIAKEQVTTAREKVKTAQERLSENFKLLLDNDKGLEDRKRYRKLQTRKLENENSKEKRDVYVYRTPENQKKYEDAQNRKLSRKLRLAEFNGELKKFTDPKRRMAAFALAATMFTGGILFVMNNGRDRDNAQSSQPSYSNNITYMGVGRESTKPIAEKEEKDNTEEIHVQDNNNQEQGDGSQEEKSLNLNDTYLVKAGTSYTGVSNGGGDKNIFEKDTNVRLYNIAIVDKETGKIVATLQGLGEEEFNRRLKEVGENQKIMVAVQDANKVAEGKVAENARGWVNKDDLDLEKGVIQYVNDQGETVELYSTDSDFEL